MVKFKFLKDNFNLFDCLLSCAQRGIYEDVLYSVRIEIFADGKCILFLTNTTHRVRLVTFVTDVVGVAADASFVFAVDIFKLKGILSHIDNDIEFEISDFYIKVNVDSKVLYLGNVQYELQERYLEVPAIESLQKIVSMPMLELVNRMTFFESCVKMSNVGLKSLVFHNVDGTVGYMYLTDRIKFYSYVLEKISRNFMLSAMDISIIMKFLKPLKSKNVINLGLSSDEKYLYLYFDNDISTFFCTPVDLRDIYANLHAERKADTSALLYKTTLSVNALKKNLSIFDVIKTDSVHHIKLDIKSTDISLYVDSIGNTLSKETYAVSGQYISQDPCITVYMNLEYFQNIIKRFTDSIVLSVYLSNKGPDKLNVYYLLFEDVNSTRSILTISVIPNKI